MLCVFGMNIAHRELFKTVIGHHNSKCGSVLFQKSLQKLSEEILTLFMCFTLFKKKTQLYLLK